MRFFFVASDGKKYGPADIVTLKQWVAEGRLNGQSLLEEEGTGRQLFAQGLPELGFVQSAQYAAPPPQTPYPRQPMPSQPYAPIDNGQTDVTVAWICGGIGFIFCPIVLSTIAIIFAAKAKGKGHPSGNAAFIFSICSLVVGILLGVLVQFLLVDSFGRFGRF